MSFQVPLRIGETLLFPQQLRSFSLMKQGLLVNSTLGMYQLEGEGLIHCVIDLLHGLCTDIQPTALGLRDVFRGSVLHSVEIDPRCSVMGEKSFHRAMYPNRTDTAIHTREDTLSLTQRVGKNDARSAFLLVGPPPLVNIVEDFLWFRPTINGQSESGLGHKGMTFDDLEGLARCVRVGLIVATDDEYFALIIQPDLSGTQYVTRRIEGYADSVDFKPLTKRLALYLRIGTDTLLEYADAAA